MLKHRNAHTFAPKTTIEFTAVDFSFLNELPQKYRDDSDLLTYVDQIEAVLKRHTEFHPPLIA